MSPLDECANCFHERELHDGSGGHCTDTGEFGPELNPCDCDRFQEEGDAGQLDLAVAAERARWSDFGFLPVDGKPCAFHGISAISPNRCVACEARGAEIGFMLDPAKMTADGKERPRP